MKKVYFKGIVLCLMVGLLFGCGADQSRKKDNEPPIALTVWTYYNGTAKEAFDALVDEFNKTVGAKENIVVDAYSQGDVNELADAVLGAASEDIGSEPMPHIFAAYSDNAYRIDQLGKVADLSQYFTEDELADFRAEFVEDGRFGADNALKIIPIAKSSENIFINATDFAKLSDATGVRLEMLSTWEGMAEAAAAYYQWTDQATVTPNDGKALFGMDSMANFMLISNKQLGNDFYQFDEKTGAATIDFPKKAARQIWDNFYVPFINGHYAEIGRFRSDDAKTGDILVYSGSTAGASYFPQQIETSKDSAYPITCAVLPYPGFGDGELVAIQQGAGMAIAKSDRAHEEASAVFLKWLTDTEQNLSFAALTGYLPVKNDSIDFESYQAKMAELLPEENESSYISAKATFNMLQSYTLYNSKPFATSYDARKVLDKSLLSYAQADLAQIKIAMDQGQSQAEAVAKFDTDENFDLWYDQFMNEINTVIAK